MPTCPGSTPTMPPATPLLAGIPTAVNQVPTASYIPATPITDITSRATSGGISRSPVTGCTPPVASVAAITARSREVTAIEHCRV